MEKDHEQKAADSMKDFFLYAPVGFLYEAFDAFPDAVKRGKSQVGISKVLAKIAADQGKKNVETGIEDVMKSAGSFLIQLGEHLEQAKMKHCCPDDSVAENTDHQESESPDLSETEPFTGYDTLASRELIKKIEREYAEKEQLHLIKTYESANKNRKTVLSALDRLVRKLD